LIQQLKDFIRKCRKSGIRGFKFDSAAASAVCEVVLADGTSIVKR
jgi:hypothetical protein